MGAGVTQQLPPEIEETLRKFAPQFIRVEEPPSRIVSYCNVCEHELARRGSEWRCVENCRCMMMGCVPWVWSDED